MTSYCIRCSLKLGHPDISFDSAGTCTICQGRIDDRYLNQYRSVKKTYEAFAREPPNPLSSYDCLFMLSGGKDSIWMLDKLLSEGKKRILAYTYNQPFESDKAVENVELVLDRLPVHHIRFSDKVRHTKVLAQAFAKAPPRVLPKEKLPCMLCNMSMKIHALLFAAQLRIPYVLFCADPVQIVSSEISVRTMVETLEESLGLELLTELFGTAFATLRGKEDHELPRLVFPFVSMPVRLYDPDRICREIKDKGLYQSNPVETHCSLFPLLNYYSYTNYDCHFYAREIANKVRNGEIPRQVALDLDQEFRHVMLRVVGKPILNEEDRASVRKVSTLLASLFTDSDRTADHLFDMLVSSRHIAGDLGIALEALQLATRS
jgi:hypothetical protein